MDIVSLANRFTLVQLQQFCESYIETEIGMYSSSAIVSNNSPSSTPNSSSAMNHAKNPR